jgi:hypothetical protein
MTARGAPPPLSAAPSGPGINLIETAFQRPLLPIAARPTLETL